MLKLLAGTAAAAALTLALATAAQAEPLLPPGDAECYAPAGDPAPGSAEWTQRDLLNQVCATLRLRDQLASPAFGYLVFTQAPGLHLNALLEQAADPTHPRGGITTLIPGSRTADPFRTIERWEAAGLGSVDAVEFAAQNGATLRGHVFSPPGDVPEPEGGFPGVVITDGSVQAYEELYFWAAQDLASNGYVVLTYDVQGQGDSDLAGEDCPGECSGVPYQQDYNFFQGARDSLDFFLSESNPARARVDADRIGIAGHSLGAAAVSEVGQCDERVKAIVAWDNLRAPDECAPAKPALGISNDYGFWVQPTRSAPDADAKLGGFNALREAGVDTAEIVLRGATHLEYTYIPTVLPASRLGERVASHYTTAWFDRYLKGDAGAFDRLTASAFDGGADATSIGAGDFRPEAAIAGLPDLAAGNVPYSIEGLPVANAVSFYHRSAYSLTDPDTNALVECEDVRAGCS